MACAGYLDNNKYREFPNKNKLRIAHPSTVVTENAFCASPRYLVFLMFQAPIAEEMNRRAFTKEPSTEKPIALAATRRNPNTTDAYMGASIGTPSVRARIDYHSVPLRSQGIKCTK